MNKYILALFALTSLSVQAQDKALLETLVSKGYLSQQEAAQVARENVVVMPNSPETKSIRLVGGVSGWYSWDYAYRNGASSPAENNSFTMRYVKFGFDADVGGGWDINLMMDFGAEGEERNYIDNITISKNINLGYTEGIVDLGFRKVNFALEQMQGDFNQYAIERSVATWFFTRPSITENGIRTNFGSRATGIFWNGNISSLNGLYYGFSITGGATEDVSLNNNNTDLNKLSFFGNVGFKKDNEYDLEAVSYDFGVNTGYASGGGVSTINDSTNSIWGVNPYIKLKWDSLSVEGEYFFQGLEDAKANNRNALAQGANLTFAWREDLGEWGTVEPIFRYSYLNTDGANFNTNYGIDYFDQNGNVNSGVYFNVANSFYFGANWYVVPAVKISLGYEFAWYDKLENNADGNEGNVQENSVKAQIQVIF